jgi:hypothetical protein
MWEAARGWLLSTFPPPSVPLSINALNLSESVTIMWTSTNPFTIAKMGIKLCRAFKSITNFS